MHRWRKHPSSHACCTGVSVPLPEGFMEVVTEQGRPRDMGTRSPLSAGISVRSEGRGPWTSAVEAVQHHELRLLSSAPTGAGEEPGSRSPSITTHLEVILERSQSRGSF